jgi:hypothetical protein
VSANSTTSANLERFQRFIGYFETNWARRFPQKVIQSLH